MMLFVKYWFIVLVAIVLFVSDGWGEPGNKDAPSIASPIKTKQSFPPDVVLQLSFKSKIDGSVQPFLAKIPRQYDPQKKWPLLVVLHGMGDGPILASSIDSMVQIGPYGRGDLWYKGEGEQDVLECLEVAKEIFSVDTDRIYLCGFSMGGAGTFNLGLRFPHIWAGCVPICGLCDDDNQIANGRNLPFWIHTGGKDTVLPPLSSRWAYDVAGKMGFTQWRYTEHPDMGHSFHIDWQAVEKWLLNQKHVDCPKVVSFSTKDLNAARAYWVEITNTAQPDLYAQIHANIDGQCINLKTTNISGYRLYLKDAAIDLKRRITIKQNEKEIFTGLLDKDGLFTHSCPTNTCNKENVKSK